MDILPDSEYLANSQSNRDEPRTLSKSPPNSDNVQESRAGEFQPYPQDSLVLKKIEYWTITHLDCIFVRYYVIFTV